MKKKFVFAILTMTSLSLFGDMIYQYDKPFGWVSSEIMSQGGGFTAIAGGFNSIMTNPAGFAYSHQFREIKAKDNLEKEITPLLDRDVFTLKKKEPNIIKEKGEVTILGIVPWLVINPFLLDLNEDIKMSVFNQLIENGLGGGVHLGGGYIGHGLGFGLVATLDASFPRRELLLSTSGEITATLAFVGGYAHKFYLGPVELAVGADIRPMWKIKAPKINIITIYSVASSAESFSLDLLGTLSGWGIGFDTGLLAKWKYLSFGISIRDIGHTRYQYRIANWGDGQFSPFTGTASPGLPYVTPMTLRLGFGFFPNLEKLSTSITAKLHAEFIIPLIDENKVVDYDTKTFWANLNLGGEVKFFQILSLRGGYSGGYLTAGFGVDMFIAELNAALYSTEEGERANSKQQMGVAMELVFRF